MTASNLTTTSSGGVATTALSAGAGAVAGTVTPTSSCGGMSTQVILYLNGSPLYQTVAPPYGNFEIQATPGSYVVVAQASNGCGIQQSVTVTAGQVAQVSLTLSPGGAGGANTTTTGSSTTTGYYPACYYSYYGCAGMYYPGVGTIALGKPNIYLSGAPGTEVKVSLSLSSASNLLVATPAHGPGGWDVKIGADGHQLISGAATYPYLFYDLRTGAEKFTDERTFCVQSADLEPALEKYLEDLGFRPNEIRDFGDYWAKRFPAGDSYCVYPQETEVANAAVPLQITPSPTRITRVWFLVVPQKAPPSGSSGSGGGTEISRFLKLGKPSPRDTLFAQFAAKRPNRGLASDDSLTLREWGVALVFE